MTEVLKAMAFGSARRERQDRIEAIQGLNSGFLIDTKHSRMLRGMQIQSNNVGSFGFEVGIIRGHIALQPMGADHGWSRFAPPSCARYRAPWRAYACSNESSRRSAPFVSTPALVLRSRRRLHPARCHADARKTGHAFFLETPLPATDVIGTAGQALGDNAPAQTFIEHHDQPCAFNISRCRRMRACQRQQRRSLVRSESES